MGLFQEMSRERIISILAAGGRRAQRDGTRLGLAIAESKKQDNDEEKETWSLDVASLMAEIMDGLSGTIYGPIADRLIAGDFSQPAWTAKELRETMGPVVKKTAETLVARYGEGLDEEQRQIVSTLLGNLVDQLCDTLAARLFQESGPTSIERHERAFRAAIRIAFENYTTPEAVYEDDELYDELIRRCYSREEYVQACEKGLGLCENVDKAILSGAEPTLRALADGDEDLFQKMMDEAKQTISEEMRTEMEETMRQGKRLLEQDTNRIYGPAN